MSFRKTINDFQDYAIQNGKKTVDNNGNTCLNISVTSLANFMTKNALDKIKMMSEKEIKDMVKKGDLKIKIEKPI